MRRPASVPSWLLPLAPVLVSLVLAGLTAWIRAPPSASSTGASAFNANNAQTHLTAITAKERPITSRANWDANRYIWTALQQIQAASPARMQLLDHSDTVLAYDSLESMQVAMDATNILVRVPSAQELQNNATTTSSLLVSAHYDSVPTSKGVGDDGYGVASMIEMVRVLVAAPALQQTSVVFHFNNGEELGLLGAIALNASAAIPSSKAGAWWKSVRGFVNIDSVCPTGRPILYRSTSPELLRVFKGYSPYPHSSVSGQTIIDLMGSYTDYSVYSQAGVPGVDFAFYDNRRVYHTDSDDATLAAMSPKAMQMLGDNVIGIIQGVDAEGGIDKVMSGRASTFGQDQFRLASSSSVFGDLLGHSVMLLSVSGLLIFAAITLAVQLVLGVGAIVNAKRQRTPVDLVIKQGAKAFGLVLASVLILVIVAVIAVLPAAFARPAVLSGYPFVFTALAFFAGLLGVLLLPTCLIHRRYARARANLLSFPLLTEANMRAGVAVFWALCSLVYVAIMPEAVRGFMYYLSWPPLWYILSLLLVAAVEAAWDRRHRARTVQLPASVAAEEASKAPLQGDLTAQQALAGSSQGLATIRTPASSDPSLTTSLLDSSARSQPPTASTYPFWISLLQFTCATAFPLMVSFDTDVSLLQATAWVSQTMGSLACIGLHLFQVINFLVVFVNLLPVLYHPAIAGTLPTALDSDVALRTQPAPPAAPAVAVAPRRSFWRTLPLLPLVIVVALITIVLCIVSAMLFPFTKTMPLHVFAGMSATTQSATIWATNTAPVVLQTPLSSLRVGLIPDGSWKITAPVSALFAHYDPSLPAPACSLATSGACYLPLKMFGIDSTAPNSSLSIPAAQVSVIPTSDSVTFAFSTTDFPALVYAEPVAQAQYGFHGYNNDTTAASAGVTGFPADVSAAFLAHPLAPRTAINLTIPRTALPVTWNLEVVYFDRSIPLLDRFYSTLLETKNDWVAFHGDHGLLTVTYSLMVGN
ncbi:hypothetical protein RI367_007960 [Sorochytrium milnesiophthora]